MANVIGVLSRRKFTGPVLALLSVLLTAWLMVSYRFSYQGVSLTETVSGNPVTNDFSFPFLGESSPGAVFRYTLTITPGGFAPSWIRIIPDDELLSLRVNGAELPLSNVRPESLRDWNNGFSYPIGRYLARGVNRVEMDVRNNGGKYGLSIGPSVRDALYDILCLGFGAAVLFSAFIILRRWTRNPFWTALLLGALAVRLLYLWVTPWTLRGHDATGHLDYIDFLLRNFSLPSSGQGFEFYHPPLYYIIAAAIAGFLEIFHSGRALVMGVLQFFSLSLNMVFVSLSLLTLRDWLRHRITGSESFRLVRVRVGGWTRRIEGKTANRAGWIVPLAAVLFAFWPSGIIHSVRIGNDALLYPLFAAGVYYLQRWWFDNRDPDLYRSAVVASLAVMTKTNALVLFALIGTVAAIRWLRSPGRFHADVLFSWGRKFLIAGAIGLAGLAVAFVPRMIEAARGENKNLLVANVTTLDSGLKVGNSVSNYVWLDAREFVTVPYASPWEDRGGRQLFWNYLLKTSLFGEFRYDSQFLQGVGMLLSLVFLLMLAYAGAFPFLARIRDLGTGAVPLAEAAILLAAAVGFRVMIPAASSNDFRYILPILMPFAGLYAYVVHSWYKRGFRRFGLLGVILAALFAGLTLLFFAGLSVYHLAS